MNCICISFEKNYFGVKIMKINYLIIGLLGALLLAPVTYAEADVIITGTVTNSPPSFIEIFITNAPSGTCGDAEFTTTNTAIVAVTPGVDAICVVLDGIDDPNGESDIVLGNSRILAYSAPGTQGDAIATDGWDHHRNFTFVECVGQATKLTVTDGETQLCAFLPPNTDLTSNDGIGVKDVSNALWTVEATIEDSTANQHNEVRTNRLDVAGVSGLSVSPTTCTFSGAPGINLALTCGGTPTENVVMLHEGNISEETTIQMTTSLTSGPDTIDGTNLYWNAAQIIDPQTQLPGAFQNLENPPAAAKIPATSWLRGTPDTPNTQNTHLYITLPLSLNSGSYAGGIIRYIATAT